MAEEQKKTIQVFVQAQQFSKNPDGANFSLDREQLKLINNIRHPLRYHLKNYREAEQAGNTDLMKEGLTREAFNRILADQRIVQFEGQAYLSQAAKLISFLESIERKYSIF